MQLLNITRILIFFAISTLFFHGCGGVKPAQNTSVPPQDAQRTEPPYQNAEPETYQTEVWQTNAASTDKFLISRKGDLWRIDSAYGDPTQTTALHNVKDYVLSMATKTYAEYQTGHGYDDRADTVSAITMGLINGRDKAVYETMGPIDGQTKYKVTGAPGKPVESIVTVDAKIGLPVMKEIFKIEGERTFDVTVKLTGFRTDVDTAIFELPKDFKLVSIEEMKKVLTAPK